MGENEKGSMEDDSNERFLSFLKFVNGERGER